MIGTTLGTYRIEAELGSGGMGSVWRATVVGRSPGLGTGTVVAVKVIHPHLLSTPGFFKRFLREADIGRAVVHENVVRTYDADSVAVAGTQHHFIVMEYVEGRTLRALGADLGRVPEDLCRHVGRETARGLAAIHAAGAVHRDLKPENVLITEQHAVKVMDLGVARLADESLRLSQSGLFVGSVQYAAPEQFKGGDVDLRADLHALGLILYELSTGQHPYRAGDFRAVMRRVLDEKPRRPAELNPQLSAFFEELVLQLLAKDRDRRFASAAEAADVLGQGESSVWWLARAKAIRVETRRPLRRIRIPRETAIYGREREMSLLRSLFERAKAGAGVALLVEGEAGIGKSRLVDEFAGLLQAEGEDLNFLFGSYPPGGAATDAGAFSTAYREHFGEADLGETLQEYLKPTPVLVPAFAALLRGETTPTGVEPLTKDSLQTVFVHATRALAAERPTIVLIDDLHFAPEEGRALFAALAMAVPGHRVLLVGTARPGMDPVWLSQFERAGGARVALARLGAKDLVHLLADTLRSDHLAEELAGKIALKSDGNPFFVFEILRGLRDGQFLTRKDDGTWATTRVIADIEIPSSVRELVQARLADLGRDELDALDVAACLGFEFDPAIVAAVLGLARIPLLQRLARVEKTHRLVRSAGRRFVFDHHQVQETLYDGLPQMLREEYHAAIATALEAMRPAPDAPVVGALAVELAEHFLKGAQGERAKRYLDPALTHLDEGYLNDAAIRLAGRALSAPGLLAGEDRSRILLRRASRLEFLGRAADELVDLQEATSLADAAGGAALRAKTRSKLGWLLCRVSRIAEAQVVLREAIALFRESGDRKGEAGATGTLGSTFQALSRFDEARECHERNLALSRELGDRRGEARATGNLGAVLSMLGRFDEARAHQERTLAAVREAGDRLGEATVIGNLGVVLRSFGLHDEARVLYERHLALARELGDRQGEARATANLGNVLRPLGLYGLAQGYYERSLALAREIGFRAGEAIVLVNLGPLFGEMGDAVRERETLTACLALCRETRIRYPEGFALLELGEAAANAGDPAEAMRLVEESLALRREIGHRDGVAESLLARGRLRAAAGGLAAAREDFGEAAGLARAPLLPKVAVLAAAHLALHGGDAGPAFAALAECGARLGVRERMEARFVLWQATHDGAHLAEAKRLLDHLVAHAPEACRDAMLANVRLNREIAAAAKETGA